MTPIERTKRRLQMGRVMVRTFQLINDHPVLFATLSIVIAVPSLFARYQQSFLSEDEPYSTPHFLAVTALVVAIFFFTAAVATGIVRGQRGDRAVLKESFAEIARDVYPLAAIALISSFVILAAEFGSAEYPISLLLLIPGIYIAVILTVVVPVRTIERTGFVATFERSFELTRGQRWPIFVLFLVFTVLAAVLEILIYAAVGDPISFQFDSSGRAALVSLVIVDVFNGIISGAMNVAFYFELRLIKEGIAPEAIATVFD